MSVRWRGLLISCSAVFLGGKLCNMKASALGKAATFISMFSNQNSNLLKE